MKRHAARWLSAASLCAVLFLGSSAPAQAWYQIINNTPNAVWVSHAFWSKSGFLCGYNDGCDNNGTSGWKVEGWWKVAPGGAAIIHNKYFGNAAHQIYAHDGLGHVWGGTGGWFGTPNTAFSRCEGLFTDLDIPYYHYLKTRSTACCGGSCGPIDANTTLIL